MNLRDAEPVAIAAILFIGGAYRVSQDSSNEGWALLILGSVVLGVWLTLLAQRSKKDDKDE